MRSLSEDYNEKNDYFSAVIDQIFFQFDVKVVFLNP